MKKLSESDEDIDSLFTKVENDSKLKDCTIQVRVSLMARPALPTPRLVAPSLTQLFYADLAGAVG